MVGQSRYSNPARPLSAIAEIGALSPGNSAKVQCLKNRARAHRVLVGSLSFVLLLCFLVFPTRSAAQDTPYIVAYDHFMEEPGNLEAGYFSTFGTQAGGNDFHAFWFELEYGVKAYWTSAIYLDSQTTFGDSTILTGFRFENRFRMLKNEHFINPVVYVEYEQITDADKVMKEVEGHDVASDHAFSNAELRQGHNHELELKLLLSKSVQGWNFTVNPLFVKNLSPSNPWEFGYAVGVSRWLGLKALPKNCNFCAENFVAGVEMYGGLGDTQSFGLHDTSQYIQPELSWNLPSGWTPHLAVGFGLNNNSHQVVLRWGVTREFTDVGGKVRRLFGGSK
jgi:hypothetical protein